MSKQFLVLTSNIGKKDNLIDPPEQFPNCDYIAIVDEYKDLKIWKQIKNINFSCIDNYENRRNAKIYKILSSILFPSYDFIIWTDANHNLIIDPYLILGEYGFNDLYLFQHPHRNCLYDEMDKVCENNLDYCNIINEQRIHYYNFGMPRNFGLSEMTCYIKRNNDKIKKMELMWWEQICKFSSRDQCSFSYCLWKLKDLDLKIKKLKGYANLYAGGNNYFNEIEGHLI
jgi:hypothetical protein